MPKLISGTTSLYSGFGDSDGNPAQRLDNVLHAFAQLLCRSYVGLKVSDLVVIENAAVLCQSPDRKGS